MPEPPRPARLGTLTDARDADSRPPDEDPAPTSPTPDERARRAAGAAAARCATACPRSSRPTPALRRGRARRSPPAPARSRSTPSAPRATATPSRAYLIQLRREGAGTALVDPIAFDVAGPARRRPSTAPSGSCTPPPRTCPACAEVGLRPDRALRHRARRPPARLPPRRPGHPGRDAARLPAAQGALRRRLVDPAAAGAVAGVRRPRRRGARRAARRAGRRAGRGRQGRVGPPGVRRTCAASSRPVRVDAVAAYLRPAPGPRPPRPRRRPRAVGDPRRDRRSSATSPRAGSSPTPRSSPPRQAMPTDRGALLATKGFHGRGAERYAARWVAALREVARDGRGRPARRAPRAATVRRCRAPGPSSDPVAARRLDAGPRGDGRARRASTGSRSRTCSPPTTCAARCGRRRRPASPATLLDAVAAQLRGVRRPQLADRARPRRC